MATAAAPDSGLEVKDRKWLKINIPNAFLGKFLLLTDVNLIKFNVKLINNGRKFEFFKKIILVFVKKMKFLQAVLSTGSDLVDWLHTKVHGFVDKKDARKFAGRLLKDGYIRHTVNKLTFSDQCYYVFGDLCSGNKINEN